MIHSEIFQLYKILLQLVCFAKELEFHLNVKTNLRRHDILMCFGEKKVAQTGTIVHEGVDYTWYFHGNGITWQSSDFRFHYNIAPRNNYGVVLTSSNVRDFIRFKKIDHSTDVVELDALLLELSKWGLAVKFFPEYDMYSLA